MSTVNEGWIICEIAGAPDEGRRCGCVVARAGGKSGPARRRRRELNPLDPDLSPQLGSAELAGAVGAAIPVIRGVPGWIAHVVDGRFAEWSRPVVGP